MNNLNQQSLIEIVNQSGANKPAGGISGDRNSLLGNPFHMGKDEGLRDPVCDAYGAYFSTVIGGAEPIPTATRIAKEQGLNLASAWKSPTRDSFVSALAVLEQRQRDGKPSKVMCWCAPKRCHLDTVKDYLDTQRAQPLEQTKPDEAPFRAMPEAPARTQTPSTGTEAIMETDIADSIQLLGQLPQPMLDALIARLETVKSSLNADASNYARGRLNTWIGVQWDLKNKQFIPAGFWDEQLWEFGQRLYPGTQLMLLTYSGDSGQTGTGIGLHRDDSYARFEARTLSVETQSTESTWFMRQTYPGMTYVKKQNEQTGVHEFSLPSGSLITFNCKNQHAVEPGKGRWSLNLWQCSDKFQASYRAFVETYGQSGGATAHVAQGKDLILPKPLHVTTAQRQQLNAPTVRQVWNVSAFNSRPKPQRSVAAPAVTKSEPEVFIKTTQAATAIALQKLTTEETQTAKTTPGDLVVLAGGQTGADLGGLKAGQALGLKTSGTAPHGWLVERCARFPNGANPGLSDYGLIEGPRGNSAGHTYLIRTEMNVQDSDGTLVLDNIDPVGDKGSFRTVELAEKHSKPCLHISVTALFEHPNESVLRIKDWILDDGIGTLNVAGNRESKCPGLEDRVETVLQVALGEVVRVRTEVEMNQQPTNNGNTMHLDQTTPIVIACDGACSGNPGPGGYGTIVQYPDGTEVVLAGNAAQTTNNRMELQGLIEGLKAVYGNSEAALTYSNNPVHVLTDSDLTIKCAEGTWKRKANPDLWQEYEQLPTSRSLTFEWVRGHNGHALNERCDRLAVEQSQLTKQGKVKELTTVVQQTAAFPQAKPQPQEQQHTLAAPIKYPTYLSLVNGKLQQHEKWSECQAATSGISGAKYKKVKDEFERTQTLKQWGVQETAQMLTPVRYLIYADHESCPQSDSLDVQTQTCALTQKAIKEAQKRGCERIEVIVATLNADPVNLECLQPLVVAVQTGLRKAQLSNEVAGNAPFQAEVYESPDATLDLLDLQGNPDNRLILISNGKSLGTQQIVQQAESVGVKVIGYNPEKQEYIGATPTKPAVVPTRAAKSERVTER